MYKKYLCFFLLLTGFVLAYKHPVHRVILTSFFGDSRKDHYHSGVDYGGLGLPVYPITNMKVLFYKDYSEDINSNFMGMGNFILLEDERAIRTYYAHLGKLNKENLNKVEVNQIDDIGIIGNTGRSYGAHLHIVVEDYTKRMFIDLLELLATVEDKIAPDIRSFFTIINDKTYSFKSKSSLYYMAKIPLYAVIVDYYGMDYGDKYLKRLMNIKRLKLYIDDVLEKEYDFSYLEGNNEKSELILRTGETHDEIYGVRYNYKMGDFTPTKQVHKFRIEAYDFSNNLDLKEYRITFHR